MPNQMLRPFLTKLMARTLLTENEQSAILGLSGIPEVVEAHHDFVRRGGKQMSACLVLEGVCARMGQTIEGGRQITNFYISGEMPDLHSVAVPDAYASLHAVSQTHILRIPHSDLRAIAQAYPGVSEALWRSTVCDAAISAEWIVNVGRRDAMSRIAHLICEMAVRTESVKGNAFKFDFPVSQGNLADATGLSSVHVNRSLQSLRALGSIDKTAKAIIVLDWTALQKTAGFDIGYLYLNDPIRFSAIN
jgi:CRP-like cAMP-binding protein